MLSFLSPHARGLGRSAAVITAAAAAGFTFSSGGAARAAVGSFDDVQYWVGSGSNQAALLIDFNDGKSPESLAWGYRWDGTVKLKDMLLATVRADPRLYGKFGSSSFGDVVYGIGFDPDNNGSFGVTGSSAPATFDADGVANTAATSADGGTPTDPADHYAEGWNTAFWGQYHALANPYTGGTWDFGGGLGESVSNGEWEGFSFEPGFSGSNPSPAVAVSAVPEPAAAVATILVAAPLLVSRRRRPRKEAP